MAGFSDIIGHEQIIGHLKNAIALDKVSHAYIFNGPKLSGKMMLAEAFAMALQCEGKGQDHAFYAAPANRRWIIISPISSMYPTKSRIPSGWTISVPRSITIL